MGRKTFNWLNINDYSLGTKADDEDEEGMEDKIKECEELNEEAQIPLVDLLAKYKQKCS